MLTDDWAAFCRFLGGSGDLSGAVLAWVDVNRSEMELWRGLCDGLELSAGAAGGRVSFRLVPGGLERCVSRPWSSEDGCCDGVIDGDAQPGIRDDLCPA